MLVGPGFEDLEFWVVYMRLIEEGANVRIVGLKSGLTKFFKLSTYFFTKEEVKTVGDAFFDVYNKYKGLLK